MSEQKCKWLSDDDQEVCVNAGCLVCADFCPVTQYPEICKFAEFEGKKRTQGDKVRAMSDDELAEWLCDLVPFLPQYEGKVHAIVRELQKEVQNG